MRKRRLKKRLSIALTALVVMAGSIPTVSTSLVAEAKESDTRQLAGIRSIKLNQNEYMEVIRLEIKSRFISDVNLGASVLSTSNYTDSNNDGVAEWTSDDGMKVYYGNYGGSPVEYRILESDGRNAFLDCDKVLYATSFDDSSCNWSNSSVRFDLNNEVDGFYINNFSEVERAGISLTSNAATGIYTMGFFSYEDYDTEDYIFFLSAKEATTYYTDNAVRIKGMGSTPGVSPIWWLRTALIDVSNYVNYILYNGAIGFSDADMSVPGVSPAMNLDLSNVLFTCAGEMSKTSAPAPVGTRNTEGNIWKLTLLDDGMELSLDTESDKQIARNDDGGVATITVPYVYTDESNNGGNGATQISVLITDKDYTSDDAAIKYYGQAAANVSASGSVTVTLPEDFDAENDKLYLIAEDVNEDGYTDYASLPLAVIVPDKEEKPDDNKPDEGEPDGNEPDKNAPDEGKPDSNEPDNNTPDKGEPDGNEPDNNTPDEGEPDGNEPDDNIPDESEPDGNEPDDNKPDEGEPDGNEPDDNTPDDNKPDDNIPNESEPDNNKPDNNTPDDDKPDDSTPEEGKTDDGKPDDNKSNDNTPGENTSDESTPNCGTSGGSTTGNNTSNNNTSNGSTAGTNTSTGSTTGSSTTTSSSTSNNSVSGNNTTTNGNGSTATNSGSVANGIPKTGDIWNPWWLVGYVGLLLISEGFGIFFVINRKKKKKN